MLRYSLNLVWKILGLLKIPSVIAEVALGNCAMKIHDLVDENILKLPEDTSKSSLGMHIILK